jgi:hypothetical protein
LTTDYQPPRGLEGVCKLADNMDLTGRSIVKFTFGEKECRVSSWKEAMIEILKIFNEEHPTELQKLAQSPDEGLAQRFNPTEEKWFEKIADGVYYKTLSSVYVMKRTLRELFTHCKVDQSSLTFYLGDESKKESKDSATKRENRDQMRRTYWSVALKKINDIPGFPCFHQTAPVSSGLISGLLEIPGGKNSLLHQ